MKHGFLPPIGWVHRLPCPASIGCAAPGWVDQILNLFQCARWLRLFPPQTLNPPCSLQMSANLQLTGWPQVFSTLLSCIHEVFRKPDLLDPFPTVRNLLIAWSFKAVAHHFNQLILALAGPILQIKPFWSNFLACKRKLLLTCLEDVSCGKLEHTEQAMTNTAFDRANSSSFLVNLFVFAGIGAELGFKLRFSSFRFTSHHPIPFDFAYPTSPLQRVETPGAKTHIFHSLDFAWKVDSSDDRKPIFSKMFDVTSNLQLSPKIIALHVWIQLAAGRLRRKIIHFP